MAQRAYRQRKDDTIEGLRAEISNLKAALQDNRHTFVQTNALTEALLDVDTLSPSRSPSAPQRALQTDSGQYWWSSQRDTKAINVDAWLDGTTLQRRRRDTMPMEVGLGYTMYVSENTDITPPIDFLGIPPQPPQLPRECTDFAFHLALNSSLPAELQLPDSYTFFESSYGQRLSRASTEAGI